MFFLQSGSRVSMIHIDILKEGYFVRSVIEPEIIRQIAGNIKEEGMKILKDNLDRQKAALEDEEKIDPFFKLDDEFHHLIYTMAGNAEDLVCHEKGQFSLRQGQVSGCDHEQD